MTASAPSHRTRIAIAAIALSLLTGALGFGLGRLGKAPGTPPPSPTDSREVLYWYDPMSPTQHFDKPGKSPFMDMQLVPRFASQDPGPAMGVQVDPRAVQNLGVRLASVERGSFAQNLDAVGIVDFNQRDVAIIQSRAAGFVQRVYARAPGDLIAAGAPIADILVPSWGGAQGEYLAVRRMGDPALEAAARQRLRLLGMSDSLIASVAHDGRPHLNISISTPVGGAIQTLEVRQGMTVSMGQTLAQVSGLGTVWLNAAIPEVQSGQVKLGQVARAELTAFPGETFTGRITAILPATQVESHTLQVRIELPNRNGRLRPGMYATVHLSGEARPALFVPSEAVIRTGKRNLVMLAGDAGRFQPVEVQVGREDGGRTEILAGLGAGQKVVASGQFLIDSEASLGGIQVRPLGPAVSEPSSKPQPGLYITRGVVEALAGDQITFSHDAVPQIGWPAMTMTFKLGSPALAKGIKVGDHVTFGFNQRPDGPVVHEITPAGPQ